MFIRILTPGPNAFPSTSCTIASYLKVICERYIYFQGERQNLLTELAAWCKSVDIRDVVMLASCNAFERWQYNQITGSQLRYFTSKVPQKDIEMLKLVLLISYIFIGTAYPKSPLGSNIS